jgi:hypothetical protein
MGRRKAQNVPENKLKKAHVLCVQYDCYIRPDDDIIS